MATGAEGSGPQKSKAAVQIVLPLGITAMSCVVAQQRVARARREAAEACRQLAHLAGIATTDALTGLPNRRAWDARVKRATLDHEQVAIAIFDLDNFKAFNDTHGHLAGDSILRATASVWS